MARGPQRWSMGLFQLSFASPLFKLLVAPLTVSSVPSKEILYWANFCFSAHAIVQPCRHTTIEALQALKWLCDRYTILKFGIVQVRLNEISLRKLSGSTAHLPTSEGTLTVRSRVLCCLKRHTNQSSNASTSLKNPLRGWDWVWPMCLSV